MTDPVHHLHKRKRIHSNHEEYPHPNKWKRFLDKFIYAVGIIGPVMTIPQLIKIWVQQNAAGVSVVTWASYLIIAIIWVTYGVVHKERPIIFAYSMWIIIDLSVVVGTLLYGV